MTSASSSCASRRSKRRSLRFMATWQSSIAASTAWNEDSIGSSGGWTWLRFDLSGFDHVEHRIELVEAFDECTEQRGVAGESQAVGVERLQQRASPCRQLAQLVARQLDRRV